MIFACSFIISAGGVDFVVEVVEVVGSVVAPYRGCYLTGIDVNERA